MSDGKRIVAIPASTLYREVQGETVLLQLDSGEYFGLDEVGTRLWQLMVEKGDLAVVETTMLAEFDVDAQTLSRDLDQIVEDLITKHLIEVESAPAAG